MDNPEFTPSAAWFEKHIDRQTKILREAEEFRAKDRRDRFAMAALTGLLANGDFGQEATVIMSAQIADALIAELDKEK